MKEEKGSPNFELAEKEPCGQAVETPWGRIMRQRRTLDDALVSIRGISEESKLTRMYLVAQIEALDWAARHFEI